MCISVPNYPEGHAFINTDSVPDGICAKCGTQRSWNKPERYEKCEACNGTGCGYGDNGRCETCDGRGELRELP